MGESMLSTRERILALLEREPGLYLRELSRRLDVSLATVRYHLAEMERDGRVVAQRAGAFLRLFPSKGLSRDEYPLVSAIRVRGQRKVLAALLRLRSAQYSQLQAAAGLASASLSKSLQHLLDTGFVVQDENRRYRLADADTVRTQLAVFRSRFPDLLADAAREIFDEIA